MGEPGKRSSFLAGCVALAAVVGMMLVDFFTDRPRSFVPIPAADRVCPAFYWARPSGHLLYYTTPGACTVSWVFAAALLIACLIMAADR
jgi:hypothetical protein